MSNNAMYMDHEQFFFNAFVKYFGEKITSVSPFPPHGSNRTYVRLCGSTKTAIGAVNPNPNENAAFFAMTSLFANKGLPVPQLFEVHPGGAAYMIEDLGDTTLFSLLTEHRSGGAIEDRVIETYKRVVEALPHFQILGNQDFDYSVCYPRSSFDRQSMLWDLNYFKYYFLKLKDIPFDENLLEEDFESFSSYLCEAPNTFFLYRDFQSRNIMIKNGNPYFIDYQGGRRGALQYDVASLLYDAKADLPETLRSMLLTHYLKSLAKLQPGAESGFLRFFPAFAIMRIVQALGAYGFRGYFQRKDHFLSSIPYAVKNLAQILKDDPLLPEVPELRKVFDTIIAENLNTAEFVPYEGLEVSLMSFSYRKGIPADTCGNGGGFVFDCRALHNPGRYDLYKELTGKDKPVIQFLESETEVQKFLSEVYSLVDRAVENYNERKFTHLSVSFGCTGGQHRSVFCAEKTAAHLRSKYGVKVTLQHREFPHITQLP